jgi:tRNA (adenine57-N1/adenine58-N1)-methyltransferase
MIAKGSVTAEGDIVQLVGLSHKNHIFKLRAGTTLQTHRGVVKHDELIGIAWGSRVSSHIGRPFFLLQPSLPELLLQFKRRTQIMYPKDIGFLLLSLGVHPGSQVVEAGTGSAALTAAMAVSVGTEGHIFSYDNHIENQNMAIKNLRWLNVEDRVTLYHRDISEGFDQTEADVLFLDLARPEAYLHRVVTALRTGGSFGAILPTANQVSTLLDAMQPYPFAFVEVCETLLRYYKPVPERLRPADRMVAHTGYLILARLVLDPHKKP